MNGKKTLAALVLMLAVLVTVTAVINTTNTPKEPETQHETREIAALVNGQPIYIQEIEKELATIPQQQRLNLTNFQVLDFLIEKKLLIQQADKAGIKAAQQDVDALYRTYANPYTFNLEQTEALIAQQNLTEEEFVQRLQEQAKINKLLDKKTSQFSISNGEVRQMYELNYRNKNITFEKAEPQIVSFLIKKKRENIKQDYINQLKLHAKIVPFIEQTSS